MQACQEQTARDHGKRARQCVAADSALHMRCGGWGRAADVRDAGWRCWCWQETRPGSKPLEAERSHMKSGGARELGAPSPG